MNEDQLRELFREMRDEPVPADSLARVRMAVEQRTQRSWFSWRVAAMLLATACVVVAVWVGSRPALVSVPPPPVIAQRIPAPPLVKTPPRAVETRVRKVQADKPLLAVNRPPRFKSNMLIRIETADPNVVLFFVADGSAE